MDSPLNDACGQNCPFDFLFSFSRKLYVDKQELPKKQGLQCKKLNFPHFLKDKQKNKKVREIQLSQILIATMAISYIFCALIKIPITIRCC